MKTKYIIVSVIYFWFIYSIIFYINGKPFIVLSDDEMISMYYAKNLFTGIEGYSNSLWIVIMLPCQLLPKNISSLPIILINLVCILGMMKISKNPLLLGLTFPLLFWAVRGVEFIPIAYLFFYGLKTGKIIIPIILITLLRIDGFIFALILLIMNFSYKHLYIYLGVLISFFTIRYARYGDLFPNTYYLKLGYLILDRIKESFHWHNIIYLLSPYKYIIPITLVFLYNLYIGGDAWEQYGFINRFLIITIPLFYEIESFKDLFIVKQILKMSRTTEALRQKMFKERNKKDGLIKRIILCIKKLFRY